MHGKRDIFLKIVPVRWQNYRVKGNLKIAFCYWDKRHYFWMLS